MRRLLHHPARHDKEGTVNMTAIATHTDHEARAAAWHGLQPSVDSRCPRSLDTCQHATKEATP